MHSRSLQTLLIMALFQVSLPSYAEELAVADKQETFVSFIAKRRFEQTVSQSVTRIHPVDDKQINTLVASSPNTWTANAYAQQLLGIRSALKKTHQGCVNVYQSEDALPLSNGVFCQNNALSHGYLNNAGTLEIVRGPGTAFHGNHAVHGMINLLSPSFSEQTQTNIRLMSDFHQLHQAAIDHREQNMILQLFARDDAGFRDNNASKEHFLRVKAKQSGEKWQLEHKFSLNTIDEDIATPVVGENAYQDPSRKKENLNNEADVQATSFRYSTDFRFQPKSDSELIVTPFLRAIEQESFLTDIEGMPQQQQQYFSLGLQSVFIRPYSNSTQLSSGFDLDYSWGSILQRQDDEVSAALPNGEHFNFDLNSWDIAMFIQSDMQISQYWRMDIGLRLQNTRYDYSNKLSDGSVCTEAVVNCRYYRTQSSVESYFNWSPHLNLSWQISPNHFSVLNINKAFRTPHSDELYRLENGQIKADLDAEELLSAEWGFKGMAFNTLEYALMAFVMHKDHVIVKDSQRYWRDDMQTTHQGMELNIKYAVFEQLILSTALSFSRHRYDNNVQLFNSDTSLIKGKHIVQAPEQLHQISLTWLGNQQSLWQYQLELEAVYIGDYFLDSSNNTSYEGHTLTYMRYAQQLPQQWQINLAVINLLDVDYAELADLSISDDPSQREQRYIIGEPRQLRLSINKTF